jgi:hypothetical protein
MGADKDTRRWLLSAVCSLTGDDIRAFKDGAVVAFQVGFLQFHTISVLFELLLNPLSTLLVCFAVHGARPKTALGCTEGIRRVCIELNVDD